MATLPTTQAVYHYGQLKSEIEWPIRLLDLHPAAPETPLCCHVENASLDSSVVPEFDALSYVWGPSDGKKTVLNVSAVGSRANRCFYILPSLATALHRLRHPTDHRLIWVDALCINQSDDDERSQQIPMMGKIYHCARSVVIWLGEEAEESDLAMKFIPRITDLSKFDQIIKDPGSTAEWYALSRLMNRPWFSRRWVVQELAFAKSATLYCGNADVDWALFADAATLFGQKQQYIVKLFWLSPEYAHDAEIFGEVQAFGALRLIYAVNRLFRRSEDNQILEGLVNLETLVTSLNVFETKDPRDSIYAVMPLAEDTQNITSEAKSNLKQRTAAETAYPTLSVDYIFPFDEIARGFVAFCIKNSNSLDILCRPWAPVPNYYCSPDGSPFSYQLQQRISSWACTLDDAVFETRQDGHYVRKRGDSFVGPPGRPIYQASKGFPFVPFNASLYLEPPVQSQAQRTGPQPRPAQADINNVSALSTISRPGDTVTTHGRSSFPHAFERWETISSHWERLTAFWIRRLEENSSEINQEPLAAQLSRQVTDLSAAGANLFHAVVELQRLRASSERKFQRWFFETRAEQERSQELLAIAEQKIEQVRLEQAEMIAEAIAKERQNWNVSGYVEMARVVEERSKELQAATAKLEQERLNRAAAIADAIAIEREKQTAAGSYLEMARFPVDSIPSAKAPRMEVKGIIIGIVKHIGERAMEGTIPSGWFSMANWVQRRSPIPETLYRILVADRNADGGNPPSWYKRALEHALTNSGMSDVRLQRMINQSRSTVTGELLQRVQSVIWNRRFVITDKGAFGLVPAKTLVGDVVMVLYGASVPVIVRKLSSSYWLVGECYIHGSMDGMKSSSSFGARSSKGSSDDLSSNTSRMKEAEIVTLR